MLDLSSIYSDYVIPPFSSNGRPNGIRAYIWYALQDFIMFPVRAKEIKLSIEEKTGLKFNAVNVGRNLRYWCELGYIKREKIGSYPYYFYTPTERFWSYISNLEVKKCCKFYKCQTYCG